MGLDVGVRLHLDPNGLVVFSGYLPALGSWFLAVLQTVRPDAFRRVTSLSGGGVRCLCVTLCEVDCQPSQLGWLVSGGGADGRGYNTGHVGAGCVQLCRTDKRL